MYCFNNQFNILYKKTIQTMSSYEESNWFDYIKNNPDKQWNYHQLSRNPNVTWDIVAANPDKPWNYEQLSCNKMYKHPFFNNQQLFYVLK